MNKQLQQREKIKWKKINKEIDMDEHSLAIHYDYDIVPLPDDIIDKANKIEREK